MASALCYPYKVKGFCEIACFGAAIISALMVSIFDAHPLWIGCAFLSAVAYSAVVHAPLRDKTDEVQERNHVYFNNRARLIVAAVLCFFTPWYRPMGVVIAAVEFSFLISMIYRVFKNDNGEPLNGRGLRLFGDA
ncbi:hypothetical protein SAMN05421595_1311 [Austwickia chelonae]|uniref:hypothetical protein n=1 Tax=Austwickia chelonae TaxID=100225 RepID=UPI00058E1FAD|nr:hypothetical protein [Austwickia chelonae]SEW11176.1 hypothetical protein SAMN05421595_1311 [Austwickia chelonae]